MTKIQAKVIADSKNEFDNRITTMVVTFPRFILAELNTHRMMSRNSASSRAIPFEKMLQSVSNNPFVPIAFQKDHKGMQGTEYLEGEELNNALSNWGKACDRAIEAAKILAENGVTKQLCNRLLEPFMWHTVIITATEWENFFALRCPKYEDGMFYQRSKKDWIKSFKGNRNISLDNFEGVPWLEINKGQAEIHMMTLAEAMWDAYNESTPKELIAGEWHIPFGDNIPTEQLLKIATPTDLMHKLPNDLRIKIATARCARVSYTVVGEEGKEPNYENDIKLHDRLAESGHWSPFEHCAQTMKEYDFNYDGLTPFGMSGNFQGFKQYRKTFNNENITK